MYYVIARTVETIDGVHLSLFDRQYPRVFGPYESRVPHESDERQVDDIFQQFLEEHCRTHKDAQRFFNAVKIIKVDEVHERRLSDVFGELMKFPNPRLFTEVDYYIHMEGESE